jgi:2-polyprenyl-3-methyl-5-hydroxy-6-metoxy-1,4-benzoquinol methylase
MDKAGQKYWNDSWAASKLPDAMNPSDLSLDNYVNRRFHDLFVNVFGGLQTQSLKLLEVGCAKSVWLPYFSREFGFDVSGLDYSPIGCEMASKIIRANGVDAEIFCADLFSPPLSMLEQFDVIVSFGVVEHFEDTAVSLNSISALLKPGGLLITSIPNMVGLIGHLQKILNKPVYDIHQPIDSAMLLDAHKLADLDVVKCEYFVASSFGVANLEGVANNSLSWLLKKLLLGIMARFSKLVWMIENIVGFFPPSKSLSPYIYCVARKRLRN